MFSNSEVMVGNVNLAFLHMLTVADGFTSTPAPVSCRNISQKLFFLSEWGRAIPYRPLDQLLACLDTDMDDLSASFSHLLPFNAVDKTLGLRITEAYINILQCGKISSFINGPLFIDVYCPNIHQQ